RPRSREHSSALLRGFLRESSLFCRPMKIRWVLTAAAIPAVVALQLAACGPKPAPKPAETTSDPVDAGPVEAAAPEPPKPKSLFERLGGKDAIAKVVDSF